MNTAAVVATLLVAATGTWATCATTDTLRAFTTESARRLSIERAPRPVPDVRWRDATLDPRGDDGIRAHRPVRIVDFIYTRCPSVCQAAGGLYAQLQEDLATEIAAGRVELLSVGFDLEHDTPAELADYRSRFGGGRGWRTLAPLSSDDLEALARVYGVIVRPDEAGGFVHNAALHVVDTAGRLVAVFDLAQWQEAGAKATRLANHGDER